MDIVLFQVTPEGRFADAKLLGHFLTVALMLFHQGCQLDCPAVLIEHDLLGARQQPGNHLFQLFPQERLINVPLLGQQDKTLADAVELVQIAGSQPLSEKYIFSLSHILWESIL